VVVIVRDALVGVAPARQNHLSEAVHRQESDDRVLAVDDERLDGLHFTLARRPRSTVVDVARLNVRSH